MTIIEFESIPINECNEILYDVGLQGLLFEPMYFNQGLSDSNRIFLRKTLINKLLNIQKFIEKEYGYRFKIWDGFRSREVQLNIYNKFWNQLKDKNPNWSKEKIDKEVSVFVTDPSKIDRIPPHSTGGSVDLTLLDKDGEEIDMGTEFDFFGDRAASMYYENNNVNEKIRCNRKILRESMALEGFRFDKDEWWHFDYGNQLWAVDRNINYAIYGEYTI